MNKFKNGESIFYVQYNKITEMFCVGNVKTPNKSVKGYYVFVDKDADKLFKLHESDLGYFFFKTYDEALKDMKEHIQYLGDKQ